jgi:hypothetical protein
LIDKAFFAGPVRAANIKKGCRSYRRILVTSGVRRQWLELAI